MAVHRRRKPTHHEPVESGAHPVIVLVTVCTRRRRHLLFDERAHQILTTSWEHADNWSVGRYVVLPDHIHLFCAPNRVEVPLTHWVQFWKSEVSRQWPDPREQPIWQRDFWDTQLRCGESYEAKWEYVRNNPVRHGLVAAAEDWPYAGELNVFDWD